MTVFRATNESEAVVPADRMKIWAVLTDPVVLPQLTPLLRSIDTRAEADGDLWRWHMVRIAVLGVGISTTFTERMRFEEGRRIDYAHEPPAGTVERTGADGHYVLTDTDEGTHLAISLTLHVDLPLSRLATPAVTQVMRSTMQRTGDRFGVNLLRHLGVSDPHTG